MTIEIIKWKTKNKSKQKEDLFNRNSVLEPNISFSSMLDIYKNSFIASGITDKIATSIQTWFKCSNEELIKKVEKIDFDFLIKNLVITWNSFFEVIRNWKWDIDELLPVLTEKTRLKENNLYTQKSWIESVDFNCFTKLKQRDENFDNNLNEIYHFKTESLRNKNYWSSLFEGVIDQLALISYIDKYYSSYFENQAIRPNVFTDPEGKLSTKDKEVISEFFKTKMKWVDKAFSTAIIPANLQKLELWDELNTDSFINYRKELIKSVCIRLNIPSDLLLSESSNRSTSEVAKEIFNTHTVKPLQNKILKDLKEIFSEEEGVSDLRFKDLDIKDQREEAEIFKIYAEAWIMSIEEIRKELKI